MKVTLVGTAAARPRVSGLSVVGPPAAGGSFGQKDAATKRTDICVCCWTPTASTAPYFINSGDTGFYSGPELFPCWQSEASRQKSSTELSSVQCWRKGWAGPCRTGPCAPPTGQSATVAAWAGGSPPFSSPEARRPSLSPAVPGADTGGWELFVTVGERPGL